MPASDHPPTDIVVFGATSFVGEILCRYLGERHGFTGDGPEGLTWAVAGRSRSKLDDLIAQLGEEAGELSVIVADAHEEADVRRLAQAARVVVSTVGPYAIHGSALVAACAGAGTDYLDLAGETPWVRRMIDAHQASAEASGARLVPSSGFDSIPSDLGVHVLQQTARERTGSPAARVRMGVKAIRGGVSGGTVHSMLNILNEVKADPSLRKQLANPFALCPEGQRSGPRQPNVNRPVNDAVFGRWAGPFVMAAINTRVVHRTNALTGHAYGEDFVYDEVMLTGSGPVGLATAAGLTVALGAFVGAAAAPGLGTLVEKLVPEAGEGPSPDAQEEGSFDLRFYGVLDDSSHVQASVTGDRDPGYGSTAKMLGEAAACMARDVPARDEQPSGGFWTPASLLGDELVARLEQHAGLSFEVR